MIIDQDMPEKTRQVVKFRNGNVLLISAEKAASDAKNFRFMADVIRAGQYNGSSARDNATRASGALLALADQFEAALNPPEE